MPHPGMRLDHAVWSLGGARQLARTDLPTMMSLLDIRHVAGDPDLAGTLHRRMLSDWRTDARDRLHARQVEAVEGAQQVVLALRHLLGGLLHGEHVLTEPHEAHEVPRDALRQRGEEGVQSR